ncbi:S9 family peptidase [Pedobacter sp. MC2016-15]|uniref:S9 family peptidase n=1 Tax=Pedobacter sp. MC2016-15 TaxID=2994473 RepID=UPI002246B147|nr:S9 family peptidase [Pedobacter sp. MC2016-15]MCX2480243.1 S9 family peptidase [Pedobacter sp. MC2016-15]
MKIFVFLVASTLLSSQLQAQVQKEGIAVTDLLLIKRAGNVQISPSGSTVLFSVNSIVPSEKDKNDFTYKNQFWKLDLRAGAKAVPFVEGKEAVSQPAYSPDGKRIAFLRNVKGKQQIFLLQVADGKIQQISNFKYGAGSLSWSPNGRRILFTSSISLQEYVADASLNPEHKVPAWNDEKPGFSANEDLKITKAKSNANGSIEEIRAYLSANESDKKAKVLTRVQFQNETTTTSELRFTHVFIMDADSAAVPKAITRGFYSFSNPKFLSNDKLVLTSKLDSLHHPDNALEDQIYTVNADGSGLTKLLGEEGKSFSVAAVSESGKWLAYQTSVPGTVNVPQLFVKKIADANAQAIKILLDRSKSDVLFAENEKSVYFTASSNGGSPLYNALLSNGKVTQLSSEDDGLSDFDISGNRIIYVKTSVSNPSEVYSSDLALKAPKVLTALNSGWLANKQLSIPQKYTFVNDKGLEVEYWVMKPINFDATKKYPLLLEMHGGPASMWGPGDQSMWHEFQYFCAQGIAVVYGNPRGSNGYGDAFLKANLNDWGPGPASDVLTTVDRTVALGWADPKKLLISGGSYAGYLTAWIISHDNRFLAASSQRGVYNFATFFGEANVWRMVPRYFGGYPWDPAVRKVLEAQSPVNFVQRVNTPLLMFHGENDGRTGTVQSDMFYKSLKVLGKPVEYVRHPGASHELVRSGDNRQRIDQMLRIYEFFDRYLNTTQQH